MIATAPRQTRSTLNPPSVQPVREPGDVPGCPLCGSRMWSSSNHPSWWWCYSDEHQGLAGYRVEA